MLSLDIEIFYMSRSVCVTSQNMLNEATDDELASSGSKYNVRLAIKENGIIDHRDTHLIFF